MLKKEILIVLVILLNIGFQTFAHDSNYENQISKSWKINNGNDIVIGSFFMYKNNEVYLETNNNGIKHFPLCSFSKEDQSAILNKYNSIQKLNKKIITKQNNLNEQNLLSKHFLLVIAFLILIGSFSFYIRKNEIKKIVFPLIAASFVFSIFSFIKKTNQIKLSITSTGFIDSAFIPFKPNINTFWDANYFYVESNGIPTTHEMMVGISNHGWQQQVPIPQCYTGSNAWSIPLNPIISSSPVPVNANHFSRGAIAIAVNGIAIFNPYTNTGVDAFLDGQLDNYGGHCGRADDYHYHIAPLHLYNHTSSNLPIAFGLDGFPVYGSLEPDGTSMQTLDANHGHLWNNGIYHYHGTSSAPYMIGNMVGQITEDTTHQIIPQAAAKGIRPPLTPLSGALITSCTENNSHNGYKLIYTLNGATDSVVYNWTSQGLYTYNFYTTSGLTTQTYNKTAPCTINTTAGFKTPSKIINSISIFPNPTSDFIYIKLQDEKMMNDIESISLYSSTGQNVFNRTQFISELDVRKLTSGIYILKIKMEKGEFVKRIKIN